MAASPSAERPRRGAVVAGGLPGAAAVAALLVLATGSAYGREVVTGSAPGNGRPNIVLIVTDDQRRESIAEMPNVRQRLLEQGLSFERAFVTTPECCPSRASILRGQYAHNHRTLTAIGFNGGFFRFFTKGRDRSTVATWLDEVGYQTFFAGKYFNGYSELAAYLAHHARNPDEFEAPRAYVPPGWDGWHAVLGPIDYFDYQMNENGVLVEYGSKPEEYLTDVLADRAVEFIRSMAGVGDPFFVYIAPLAPHGARHTELPVPAPRHTAAFVGRQAPRGPSFNEADFEDKTGWLHTPPLLDRDQIAEIDRTHRARLRSMLAVDELVGRVFAALAEAGKAAKTVVIYTTDNGYRLGEHRGTGKRKPWEEDIGVPLLITGPGVEPGRRDELVLLSDLAPTLAGLAGVEPPAFVDGRSLEPLLAAGDGEVNEWRRAFAIEAWERRTPLDTPYWKGIRTETQKYFEVDRAGASRPCELYDLAADPFELQNVCASAEPTARAQLAEWMEALSTCAGEECRTLEDGPPEPAPRGPEPR